MGAEPAPRLRVGGVQIELRAPGALAPLLHETFEALRPHLDRDPEPTAGLGRRRLSLDFDVASTRPTFHAALATEGRADIADWAIAPAPLIAIWDILAAFPEARCYSALALRPCSHDIGDRPGPIDSIRFDAPPEPIPSGPGRCGGLVQYVTAPHTRCWVVFLTITVDAPAPRDLRGRLDGRPRMVVTPDRFGFDATAALTDFLRDLRPNLCGFVETVVFSATLAADERQISLCLAVDDLSRIAQAVDCICWHASPASGSDHPLAIADRLFDARRAFAA